MKNLMSTEIDQIDIAAGIKEFLINKGFKNSDEILKIDLDELASRLGMDLDIAKSVHSMLPKNNNYPMISDQLTMLTLRDMCTLHH
jgi:hypothetical protein